jgi:hypothetical protein
LADLQALVQYWGTGYDWRKAEAKLNALPQFVTKIDGMEIHFIHVRSRHSYALPVIISHGWRMRCFYSQVMLKEKTAGSRTIIFASSLRRH